MADFLLLANGTDYLLLADGASKLILAAGARAILSVQELLRAGLQPSYAAAAGGGHMFFNDGNTFVHVLNSGGSSINVTFQTPVIIDEILSVEDLAVTVPGGEDRFIGPFLKDVYNQPGEGAAYVDYTTPVNVTIGAFRLRLPYQLG